MTRPAWDFDYFVVSRSYAPGDADDDIIVALRAARPESEIARALASAEATVEAVLVCPPVFWYRVRLGTARSSESVARALDRKGLGVRYATSATRGALALGEPLDAVNAPYPTATDWQVRTAGSHHEPRSEGRWVFYERCGADIDRAACGTGAGTRLAVIDDEAMDAEVLPLDKEVFVGTKAPSRSALHGSLMVAWAVGVRPREVPGRSIPPFAGVAPDASARLYLIPRPGRDVVSLPQAIVQAVRDGADVVVCAAYIEGTTSPLLDDALAFANRLGRRGRGTAVVLPTGREISSPPGSLHASLTLSLGDPASDPRVLCVAPSGREGGWFLWTDKRGKLRPFANRGPAVRVAAPGDDMSYPFATSEQLGHAESSGASAFAAGVALLVLGKQPDLRVDELYDVLATTASREDVPPQGALADAADFRPPARDMDGHDAKCGYGRLSARRACLCVADPVAQVLVLMGEDEAARTWLASPASADDPGKSPEGEALRPPYSPDLARWAARRIRTDSLLSHSLRVVVRHYRLGSQDPARLGSQPACATARQLALVCERLLSHDPPPDTRNELTRLYHLALAASRGGQTAEALETWCSSAASRLFDASATVDRGPVRDATPVGSVGRSA